MKRLCVWVFLFAVVVGAIMTVIEVPDWYRTVALVGVDGSGEPHVVLLDTAGNLVAVMKGDDSGTLRSIAVDGGGQMYTLIKGSDGEDIAVDASGNLAALMKGVDGVTLRTVAVDGDGNLVAVIKGDDAGTLRTASVNVDGRFEIVPYDPEDVWGNALGMGNAELASILTPCKRFDRRGNVIFWDSFEDGLGGWKSSLLGTGASVKLSSVRSSQGAYSVALTGGSDGSRSAFISRYLNFPSTTRHGVEVAIAWEDDVEYIQIDLGFRDGTNYYGSSVEYAVATEDYEYKDSAGFFQDIDASKPLYNLDYLFHRFKFVIDTSTQKYVRAFLDDEEYDLSDIGIQSSATALLPMMVVHV